MGDRVLIKIKAAEEKSAGGILLPSTAQTKPQGGEVVAVGEGRTVGQNKVDISVKVNFHHLKHYLLVYLRGNLVNGNLIIYTKNYHSYFRLEHQLCTPSMLEQRLSSMGQTICY